MSRGERFDRSEMRKETEKRQEESYRRKDGGGFGKYFKTDVDYPLWTPAITKEDPHLIDIVMFRVGDNFPLDDKGRKLPKGSWAYYLDIYIHQNVGPSNSWVVCPAKNYGLPCPICEYVDKKLKDGVEWKDIPEVTKRRCVYNILCYDTAKEEDKGVQIFEVSHHYMEKVLQQRSRKPRGGGTILYADSDVGKAISFHVANDEMKTINAHEFLDREIDGKPYIISDEDLADAFTLDEIIEIRSYDELYELFYGKPSGETKEEKEDTGEEGGRSRRGSRYSEEKPKEDDVPVEVEGKCSFKHILGQDIDKFDECTKCPDAEYEGCNKKKQELLEAAKKESEGGGGRARRGR